jgi:hypothetical protein
MPLALLTLLAFHNTRALEWGGGGEGRMRLGPKRGRIMKWVNTAVLLVVVVVVVVVVKRVGMLGSVGGLGKS